MPRRRCKKSVMDFWEVSDFLSFTIQKCGVPLIVRVAERVVGGYGGRHLHTALVTFNTSESQGWELLLTTGQVLSMHTIVRDCQR